MSVHSELVPFRGDEMLAVDMDGQHYVAIKPICGRLGLDWSAQFRKLKARSETWGVAILAIPSAGGEQETVCLPVNRLAMWLTSIHANKVKPEFRDALVRYQAEAADVLDRHFRLKDSAKDARLADLQAQLAASRTHILASHPRWAKIVTLRDGQVSKFLTWKRTGLSWDYFRQELAEMERCGLHSEDDWHDGSPRTLSERLDAAEVDVRFYRTLREQAEARIEEMRDLLAPKAKPTEH